MKEDRSSQATKTTWFDCPISYAGPGRADFADPPGWIEGPTEIQFNEFGEVTCVMIPSDLYSERNLPCGPMEFIHGEKPVKVGNAITMGFSGRFNHCNTIEVKTPKGIFRAQNISLSGVTSDLFNPKELRFRPWRSEFLAPSLAPSKYWVLPLWNFVSDFHGERTPVDSHPLRFKAPAPPSQSDDSNERMSSDLSAANNNLVIWFPFCGSFGFIEPLPDYKDRVQSLKQGRAQRLITAIMVGEVGSLRTDISSFEKEFPAQILTLLELATGIEVGSPWVEIRGEDGTLVKRLHLHLGNPYFHEGRQAISQMASRGIGYLISKALGSDFSREDAFMVVARNLVRASSTTGIEASIRHISVALEVLCDRFGFSKTDLLVELPNSIQSEVGDLLAGVKKQIEEIRDCHSGLAQKDRDVLSRIAERVEKGPAQKDNHFGLSVLRLIEHFGFPDHLIADIFFQPQRAGRGKGFSSALSWARGQAVHRGYFDIKARKEDLNEVVAIGRHLQDLVIRILLKLLGYDDLYQPVVVPMTAAEPVDWVKKEMTPDVLGYH